MEAYDLAAIIVRYTPDFSKQSIWCLVVGTPLKHASDSDKITRGLDFVYVYIDEMILMTFWSHPKTKNDPANTWRVRGHNKSREMWFGVNEIKFLGYTVTAEGIKLLAERVDAIIEVLLAATVKDLRRYLRMINFYRRFIPGAAQVLQLFNDLF